jgi:hypothetical protein
MVMNPDYKLAMPGSSWTTIQKILKAYNTAHNREKPTVKQIAEMVGLHRPVVSSNNNFLRELGLLQGDENKLTPLGNRLANGLELNNQSLVIEAIQESVLGSPGLTQLSDMLRARSTMTLEAFEGYVATLGKLSGPALNYLGAYTGTIIDYLVAGELIKEDGSNLIYSGNPEVRKRDEPPNNGNRECANDPPPPPPPAPPPPPPGKEEDGIPIPLGLKRVARLTLPEGWTSKELPKLLKMIELALGEEDVKQ